MNVNTSDIMITSLETVTSFNIVTGEFRFTLDDLKNFDIAQSQEKTDITGKQGRKIGSLKRNKAVKISGPSGIISTGLMELQTGSAMETNKDTDILWTDYLDVKDNKATLTGVAMGEEGSEIKSLHVRLSNGMASAPLTQAATASAGKFAYDPGTREITFADKEIEDGTENLVVFYKREVTGSYHENMSDSYSETCVLYVDAIGEDTCGKQYYIQFYIPKADFEGNFNFSMGDSPTEQTFEAESLAGTCGTRGIYWTMTIFGVTNAK